MLNSEQFAMFSSATSDEQSEFWYRVSIGEIEEYGDDDGGTYWAEVIYRMTELLESNVCTEASRKQLHSNTTQSM